MSHIADSLVLRTAGPDADEAVFDAATWKYQRCPRTCWLRDYTPPYTFVPSLLPCVSKNLPTTRPKIYSPIKPWQTRVILLKPGKFGDDLVATLVEADIIYFDGLVLHKTQENVSYDALSYSWGDAPTTHAIRCNGVNVPITQGLFFALQRLRLDRKRYLWVDALCINQADVAEKSTQVSHMFTIFKKAKSVVAWIGEKGECGHHAIDYLESFPPNTLHKFRCLSGLRNIAEGIRALCDRPWFRRAWVRQEVFAASTLHIQIGDISISWDDLQKSLPQHVQSIKHNWQHHHLHPADINLSHIASIRHLRQGTPVDVAAISMYSVTDLSATEEGERIRSTLKVLRKTCHFEATDPRDLIYGILGMTDIPVVVNNKRTEQVVRQAALLVDYTRTVSEVFQDVTKYIINRTWNLDIIAHATFTNGQDIGLPGWTPDWRSLPETTIIDLILKEKRRSYNCWLMEEFHVNALFQNENHTDSLRVSGVILGTVSAQDHKLHRRKVVRPSMSEDDLPQRLNHMLQDPAGFQRLYLKTSPTLTTSPKYKGANIKQSSIRDIAATLSRSPIWMPEAAAIDDVVVLLRGSIFPIVMRLLKDFNDTTYKLIGPALHYRFLCDELSSDGMPQRYFVSAEIAHEQRFSIR